MSQSLTLKAKGLFTSMNELGSVPEGALLVADNIDITSEDIAEPRRGFERLAAGFSSASYRAAQTWFYQDVQLVHAGTLGSESKLAYFSGGAWTELSGSYSAPSGQRLQTAQANSNLYFTTSAGVYKLDAYNGTPVLAGAYKGLDLEASLTGSIGFLADTYYTAYRIVWAYYDANDSLIRGAPSQRVVIQNNVGGSASRNVIVKATIPSGVTTSWLYQIYRSTQTTATEPSDEMQLAYEGMPNNTDLTNGYVQVTDITEDSLRGAVLYTAASQDGLANQNERPPLAKDIAVYRDSLFYANTTSKHRAYLTLLSTGGSSGLVANDTVTVGGVAYTAKASETIASAQFKVFTGGSVAQDIKDTALSLVRVINRYSSSTVYAYYLSGPDDTPGKILFEERGIGGASFTVTSSRTTCWNPSNLPDTSSNDAYPNGLAWSKPNQPEAVPLVNFVQVGDKESAILRIIPLRDSLVIFKEDGIWKLTGFYGQFSVELIDSSARLIGAGTPAILNNQIFCYTDQGIVAVSDSVKILSLPIERDLRELEGAALDQIRSQAFGVGYETERKFYLFLPTSAAATYPQQAYVYNSFTNSWVRHLLGATCGVVYDNHLYLGDGTSNYVIKDRKSYTFADYADFGFSTTISAASGTTITLASGTDNISVGDILFQSSTVFATISAVNTITSQVTVTTNPGFTLAAADVLYGISTELKWAPLTLGNPGIQKQIHTAEVLFKSDFTGTGYLIFESDLSAAAESVPIAGRGNGAWGLFNWGEEPWGGVPLRRPIRQWVPRSKQRCSQLTVSFTHSYAYSPWTLQGLSLFGTPGTERVAK